MECSFRELGHSLNGGYAGQLHFQRIDLAIDADLVPIGGVQASRTKSTQAELNWPHPEERSAGPRLEGWAQAPSLLPNPSRRALRALLRVRSSRRRFAPPQD